MHRAQVRPEPPNSRFHRAQGERSPGGTGLGPAISREIVERNKGTIGVESRPGRTVFTVALPTG